MAAEMAARVAWRSYHDWVLPKNAVVAILAGALLFLFLGLLLLAIGGGLGVVGLIAAGAVLAGLGGCGLMVCLLLCLHAYFVFNVQDEAVQTSDIPWSDNITTEESPCYAVINKPSALKSSDGTLRRNGGGGVKKVTMAPDVALDADRAPALPPPAEIGGVAEMVPASPSTPGYKTIGQYSSGVEATPFSSALSYDQRSYAQQQAFQPHAMTQQQQHQYQRQQQQQQQQQLLRAGTTDLDIQQQRQQLEYHRQHLLLQQQQQEQQQQQQQQRLQAQQRFRMQDQFAAPQQAQQVTYAQVQHIPIRMQQLQPTPPPSAQSQQSSSIVSNFSGSTAVGGGEGLSDRGSNLSVQQAASTSTSSHSYKIHTQGLQYQSGRPYLQEDDDYDNPAVERSPMLTSTVTSAGPAAKSKKSFFSSSRAQPEPDIPEPSPLVHPSARRPMTFEQQSSSKMSIYDNVLFPYAENDGE